MIQKIFVGFNKTCACYTIRPLQLEDHITDEPLCSGDCGVQLDLTSSGGEDVEDRKYL